MRCDGMCVNVTCTTCYEHHAQVVQLCGRQSLNLPKAHAGPTCVRLQWPARMGYSLSTWPSASVAAVWSIGVGKTKAHVVQPRTEKK